MMLRGLLHEIVRRRLWPIPVAALLVAAAAPLLFLKSPSQDAALAPQTAPTLEASSSRGLPVDARRLLRTKPAPTRSAKGRRATDPFEAPASGGSGKSVAAEKGSGTTTSPGASTTKQEPVPVVITDEDGKVATPSTGDDSSTQSGGSDSGHVAVDVRFAKTSGQLRRSLPRLTPLIAEGRVVATFVKYSPSRNKAVFAISPNTHVAGPECRREARLCRYVELSRGKSATLTIFGPKGSLLTRRLAVVRTSSRSGAEPRPPLAGRCLLSKLRKLGAGDPAVLSDACD